MQDVSVVVFGPSEGLRAFRLPAAVEVRADDYGLSSSELLMKDGGSALLGRRIQSEHGTEVFGISVYRPVFEPNLKRLGQSFGVSLEFSNVVPEISAALDVLSGFLALTEEGCVRDGTFCDLKTFASFVQQRFGGVFRRAMQDLRLADDRPLPMIGNPSGELYAIRADGELFSQFSASLLEAFFHRPGGMLLSKIAVVSHEGVQFGTLARQLNTFDELDRRAALVWLAADIERRNAHASGQAKLAAAGRDLQQLRSQVAMLNDERARAFEAIKTLQAQIETLQNQPRYSLADADFTRIRQIVRDCTARSYQTASYAPQRYTEPHPAESPPPAEQIYSWTEWGLSVALLLAVGVLLFLILKDT